MLRTNPDNNAMVYTQLVLARRKADITHEDFRARYEQHMAMVARLVGSEAMPLRHTRRYVAPAATTRTRTTSVRGSPDPKTPGPEGRDEEESAVAITGTPLDYDVVVDMSFADEAAWARFVAALSEPAVARAVAEDEAAFWDRRHMSVAVVDELRETVQAELQA